MMRGSHFRWVVGHSRGPLPLGLKHAIQSLAGVSIHTPAVPPGGRHLTTTFRPPAVTTPLSSPTDRPPTVIIYLFINQRPFPVFHYSLP